MSNIYNQKDVYTAEKILAHKLIKGKRHFLIKWLGWDKNHNTWEPEKNIFDRQLIDYYFESLKEKKNRVKKKETDTSITEENLDESKESIDSENDLRAAKRIVEGLRPIKIDSKQSLSNKNSNLKRISSSNSLSSDSSFNSLNKTQRQRKASSSVSVSSTNSTRKKTVTRRKNRLRSLSGSDESSQHHKMVQDATTDFDSDTDKDEIIKNLKRNKISDSSDEDEKKSVKSSKSKTRKDSDSDSLNTFLTTNTSEEIVITDITSGVVTVTIKECLSPDGFFKRRDT